MKKIFILLFLGVSLLVQSKSYEITVTSPQLAGNSIFLAGYFNGKIYSIDTAQVNSKGIAIFSKEKVLDEGMYLFYLHGSRYYEFLVGKEQTLKAKIDTTSVSGGFQIAGAPQTDGFMALGEFITGKRKEQEKLSKQYEAVKGDEKKETAIKEKIKALDQEVIAYQEKIIDDNKGEILSLFVKALQQPQFPAELAESDTSRTYMMERYQYAKNHYWDNFDLGDKRSWRLNLLNRRLDDFMQKMIIQIPDSITPEAVKLIEKARPDSISYQLMTTYMTNYALSSKLMGMDKVFVELADKYYLAGQTPWADSTVMATISSEVRKVRHNLIGMKAADMPLQTYEGVKINLYDVKAPYTILYFYEPSCGHCKTTTPKLHDVFNKYKNKGFQVVACYMLTEQEEWKEFLDKNNLHDWINVWDPERDSYYWYYYDTSSTPAMYLLDEDKKIVAKKIDVESLDRILEHELK